ncbi:hypothetical protein Bca4012_077546 [Brassica carinata]|uniref:Uncharacterized protein n=2 Tax=Brassica oleracea TaxID=3712 RepID=A0A0D3D823_BRAOL|nr:PREDICTED: uncharacterized protein LOC106306219 isoform X1 [Brassica oleracea var. oleracea]XP_013697358.2 uncharacterized protein LOC106401396 isoform X1 [Brassica napus]
MSAPGKFDYSSAALDRPPYRSNFAAQMERSSSFRESMEHPVPTSHPSMLRGTSPIAQTDVTNFFQCLRFDPKVVAADHKSIRQGDFKRHANLALGIHGDESPSVALKGKLIPSPIPEEIKRLKAGLRENNVKARERVKIFNEASSVFNKFFPSVPTKKRSRPGGYSGERLVSGSGLGKMGIQGQTLAGGFELDPQKLDERPRTGVPNKRTRTSVMDVRSNSIVRQSAVVDRDKEIMRPANHNAVQGEDRTSAGIDGWEKSKMKKKRSCIKTDFNPNLASNKVVDGYQDLRQGTQRKPMCDSRTRLNGDSNMSRQAAANGTSGYGRSDNLAQQTSLAGHSPRPGLDPDHNSLYIEKRERSIGSDKERVNQRAVNKSNIHDEFNSSSLISNTKPNASVRGPRSGSGLPPKLSPRLHNTPSPSEWDISGCTNKSPQLSTPLTHRKRMTSNRSSSPPVTQWASQRPQKISRTARRTNLVPIVSNRDEAYSDSISDGGCSENGFGFHKRSPAASPQLRLKGENSFSTAALSESEESGPPEIKSKDKGKQSDEVDGKAAQNIPRASFLGLQSRKGSKPASGEETGDGVRRQGRTGRGFSSTRSLNPMGVEKLKNVGTAKQLRSARTILDKSESKLGRPPTRKLSGRKTCERQRATATNASPLDFQAGSDDGHEELQAAVNSAVNFAQNFPNSFWKQLERYFCFISDDHINFMKHERELFSMGPPSPVLTSSDFDSRDLYPEELATSSVDSKASPLYHRLLSALISEDSMSINEDVHVDGFGAMHDLDEDSEFSVLNDNGFRNNDDYESEDGGSAILFSGLINSAYYHCSGKILDHSPIDFSDIPYDKLGIDEKIYLEAQSIGISLEPMPSISNVEDEGIVDEIKKLEEAICKEGSKKKEMVDRLLKSAIEMKEIQERELDQLGYDKLIEMAYEKSKASRRHHTVVGKNSTNKISKQAASAFVKRTLERCRQFEETGKSCFSEPEIKDMFIARLSAAEDTLEDDNPSTSSPIGSQPSSSSLARIGQDLENNYANCSDAALEQTTRREDTSWSNRVKKRELLLDDVGIGAQLSSSTKGKRSERDRDGKGHASSRSGTNKIGRPPSLSNDKGERKPKQKANQISSSVRTPEQPKAPLPEANGEHDNLEEVTEPIFDFSQLQIPDNLGGPEFDAQPGDISSWFNMDDDEDFDIMELGVPMDDLSGLNIKL